MMVKAKVIDSTHLELLQPIENPEGVTVMITIASPEGINEKRSNWQSMAVESLNTAYSENEPEYTTKMIKEANAEYRG